MSNAANSNIWQQSGANSYDSVQGQAVQADIAGYNQSDQDFAQRYPGWVNARNQYQTFAQNLLGTQAPQSMKQGNAMMNAGSQYLAPATSLAQQAGTAGNQDMALGQKLINGQQAMDPLVQQELMRSGLQGAANSLGGAAALGGTAGQAAVGRNLGVGAENWINQQRQQGMGLQTTGAGLDNSLAGAASTLGGAGANIMSAGQGLINSATQNNTQTMAVGSSIFQPRTFGLSGSDAANIALSNISGQNNMNQFLYQTKVAAAAQNAQIGATNAGARAQASAQNSQAAIGAGTAVATTAATVAALSCWVAREVFGEDDRFRSFRFWLMNLAPLPFKRLYLKYGRSFALFIKYRPVLKSVVRIAMETILKGTPHAYA